MWRKILDRPDSNRVGRDESSEMPYLPVAGKIWEMNNGTSQNYKVATRTLGFVEVVPTVI